MRVNIHFTLYEFIRSLEIVLLGLYDKEMSKDRHNSFAPPYFLTHLPIESTLLGHNTSETFNLFQNQVKLRLHYFIQPPQTSCSTVSAFEFLSTIQLVLTYFPIFRRNPSKSFTFMIILYLRQFTLTTKHIFLHVVARCSTLM